MQTKAKRRALRMLATAAVAMFSTGIAIWIQWSPIGTWVELRTYDLRFRLRGALPRLSDATITILAIDEESLTRISDPLMLWHRHFARVIDHLAQADASAIGVDFIFSDIAAFDPEGQQALSQALLRAGEQRVPVVLSYRIRDSGIEQPPDSVRLPALAVGHDIAYVNLTTDTDDFVRRQEIVALREDNQLEPSFALAIATAYRKKEQKSRKPIPGGQNSILINFRGPEHFQRVSFVAAVEAASRNDQTFFTENFREKIVLIGLIGERGDEDLHSTSLYYWPRSPGSNRSARTPGIEIHANVIATLLEGNFIRQLNPSTQTAITTLLISSATLASFVMPPAGALGLSVIVLGSYLLLAFYWIFAKGWWLFVVSPVAGVILATGLSGTANFVLEGREKRRLRNLFQRYVNDQIIQKILEAPENLALQGEKKPVTVLFADIRSFATRSERVSAEVLVQDLNDYFKAMVRVIQAHHGMIDKFIGDGIMALFGVPVEDPDAEVHAVHAAEEMVSALNELNKRLMARGTEPISIGIGVHTGEAVVGNIGSPEKMEYTAIGDVVNTAARIESLTRKLEADVLISGDVFTAVNGKIDAKYVGDYELKGKKQRVPVYQTLPLCPQKKHKTQKD